MLSLDRFQTSKTGIVQAIRVASLIVLSGCTSSGTSDRYQHIGTAAFRRSFAGHENWSQGKFDSVRVSNPQHMPEFHPSNSIALRILNEMGLADGYELLLDHSGLQLKDTILVEVQGCAADTACLEQGASDGYQVLRVRNDKGSYSLPMENANSYFSAALARPSKHPFIVVVQVYYIMNGDNFVLSVFGKPDPR